MKTVESEENQFESERIAKPSKFISYWKAVSQLVVKTKRRAKNRRRMRKTELIKDGRIEATHWHARRWEEIIRRV